MSRALPRTLLAVLMLVSHAAAWRAAAAAESAAPGARITAVADSTAVAAHADPTAATAEARELIRNGDNDRAIEVLRATIAANSGRPEVLKDAYLLLIKTYVFLGNDYKFRPQGREASNLNYRAARELIDEALSIPALRRLEPVPAEDYPPEMVTFFAEARGRMFGAFRIVGLEPAHATVTFDGSVLAADGDPRLRAIPDLPVGQHTVSVAAVGYKDFSETIAISPGGTLERSYRLEKKRSPWWYAAGAGVLAGTVLVITNQNNGSSSGPESLPGPPPPPGQ